MARDGEDGEASAEVGGVASIEAGAIHFKEEGKLAISRHVKNLNKVLTKARKAQ